MVPVILFCLFAAAGYGQSQGEMNESASKAYQKADKELNTVYKRILTEYGQDTVFIKNFKLAQRLWVQLRDAEMKARYPDNANSYGSIFPVCWYGYLTELTEDRIKKLKVWITGIEEGDVCTGSVKIKS